MSGRTFSEDNLSSQSEACSEEELPPELKGTKLGERCVSGRDCQISERNSRRAYLSARATSPENQRAANITIPEKYESVFISKAEARRRGREGRPAQKLVPTMDLLGRHSDPRKLGAVREMRAKYECGYTPPEGEAVREAERDKFFMQNFCEVLTCVPAGESLARLSFLLWRCHSCHAFFYMEYLFCPVCEEIPKRHFLEKRHINYSTAKSFINSLTESFAKINSKLRQANMSNRELTRKCGELTETSKLNLEGAEEITALAKRLEETSEARDHAEKARAQAELSLETVKNDRAALRKELQETRESRSAERDTAGELLEESRRDAELAKAEAEKVARQRDGLAKQLSKCTHEMSGLAKTNAELAAEAKELGDEAQAMGDEASRLGEAKAVLLKVVEAKDACASKAAAREKKAAAALADSRDEAERVRGELNRARAEVDQLRAQKMTLAKIHATAVATIERRAALLQRELSGALVGLRDTERVSTEKMIELEDRKRMCEEEKGRNYSNAERLAKATLDTANLRAEAGRLQKRVDSLEGALAGRGLAEEKLRGEFRSRRGYLLLHALLAALFVAALLMAEGPRELVARASAPRVLRAAFPGWEVVPT